MPSTTTFASWSPSSPWSRTSTRIATLTSNSPWNRWSGLEWRELKGSQRFSGKQDSTSMDSKNRYHTNNTWLWVRAEHLALIGVLVVLLFLHRELVSWPRFIVAFVVIDLIGYIPGAIAYRRANGERIPPIYHHLYNLTHSYLTGGVV